MNSQIWKFIDTTWIQNDEEQSFNLASFKNTEWKSENSVPLELLVNGKLHKKNSGNLNCENNYYPTEFNNCPFCGNELVLKEINSTLPWLPPYGTSTGLKLLTQDIETSAISINNGKSLSLPDSDGHYSFCSAFMGAKQRLLIAIRRDIGRISVFKPNAVAQWINLDGLCGESNLPNWSWSIATDSQETGLALPSVSGPAWVVIDWANNKLMIDKGAGRSVGGITKIGQYIFAPVMRDSTFFMLFRKESDSSWSICKKFDDGLDDSLVASQLVRNQKQLPFFGIPVSDDSRMIAYWPCRGGYVKVSVANSTQQFAWEFRPWETDEYPATALIELGPPYRKIGAHSGYWQLCEDYDPSNRDGTINKIIKYDGDERADSEIVEYGQFFTTGRSCFYWSYDSWVDVHKSHVNSEDNTELRYPLLQFGDKGLTLLAKIIPWNDREAFSLFSELFFTTANKNTQVHVRFVLEGSGIPEKALSANGIDNIPEKPGSVFRIPLNQVINLTAFIYDRHIYIYFPNNNSCFGWSMS